MMPSLAMAESRWTSSSAPSAATSERISVAAEALMTMGSWLLALGSSKSIEILL